MPKHRERKEEFAIATKLEAFYTRGNVQFTKDGKFLLCACGEEVKILDVESGQVVHSVGVKGSGEDLLAFLLADNDETLVTASVNGILKQWDIIEKTLTRTWKSLHVGKVSCMAFDETSVLLATGGSDSTVKVWDLERKYCTHNLTGAQGVFSIVQFLEAESVQYIFGAAADYRIHVWDLSKSHRVALLEGHCSTVTSLVIIQEKDRMLSSSRDRVVMVWKLSLCYAEGGPPLKTIPVMEVIESMFLASPTLISFLPSDDGREYDENEIYFVTAGDKGVLKVWKALSGKCIYVQTNSLVGQEEDAKRDRQMIVRAMYIPALEAISIVTSEQNIILHKIQDFELLKQFVGYNDDVLDVKLLGKNKFLAVATNSSDIKVYELSTYNCQILKGHTAIVVSLGVFEKSPYFLISGSKDHSVRIWLMNESTKEIKCVFVGEGHTGSVEAIGCSKGKSRFFVSGSDDKTLKMWDVPTKVPLVAVRISLTPLHTALAHDKSINSIDVSQNDKFIATGSQDSTAKLWNAADLSLAGTMRGHRKGVWCVKFSPVDLVLATSSADGTLKIWSISDYSVLKTFEGHNASVLQVQFLAQGTQLVSCASDGLLKLWDIKNNECMKTYDGHDDRVSALTVSSKEDFLVTGAADSSIIIWKDTTQEEKEKMLMQQEEALLREQDLSNLIYAKKWCEALGLAIMLEQPRRALNIVNEILLDEESSTVLEETIQKMQQNQISTLLKFTTEWNTNSKNCLPAQRVLEIILKMHSLEELLNVSEKRAVVEALLPYSERHLSRLNRIVQDAHILNFLWHNMRLSTNS